jgi:hypothetical protein
VCVPVAVQQLFAVWVDEWRLIHGKEASRNVGVNDCVKVQHNIPARLG